MNLYKKISLALVGVVGVFALGSYFALSKTLIPAFDELEQRAAAQDMARARNGLKSYGRVLSVTSTDWGQWDETHAFMQGRNHDFEEENLEPDSLIALDLNVLVMYDLAGNPFWSMFVDTETGNAQPVTESIIAWSTATKLIRFDSPTAETRGLINSGPGPMIVSARPITHSDKSGPVVGTLVVGRLLDEPRMADLRETAKVSLDLSMPTSTDLTASKTDRQEFFGHTDQVILDEVRVTRQFLHDIHGAPIAILSVASPRSITGLRQDTVTSLIVLFAGLGTLIVIGLWIILTTLVVRPISKLRHEMVKIEEGGDLSDRVNMRRSDEIGDLSHAFDNMLQELDDARRRHIDQSFKAGMAEVAAGVLHNVRNSLMPVLNNVVMARDLAARSSGDNMRKAVDELLSGDASESRRGKLLQYLHMSRDQIDKERENIVNDLGDATNQLNHVVAILRDQEQYTHAEPVLEKVNLAELLKEASCVIPANDDIDVAVEMADTVTSCNVRAHRIGLLQVLNNVLLNAYESIARTQAGRGLISVMAKVDDDAVDPRVHITIQDSGTGIESEALEHVFDRGYTTKSVGAGGLGLHWSANALASMSGQISVFSKGAGQGAEFHLSLKAA
ncbi:MAG: CHASE4 domain-containing protein [Woeseiaceae bacterium]